MGCRFSKENWCFSLTCCFCMKDRPACYWIGGVGLVWGGFATIFDFISAHLPSVYCVRCIDYKLNQQLSLAGGWINAVQWFMSCVLIHGARKPLNRRSDGWWDWLAWSVVRHIGMQLLWMMLPASPCHTLPPSGGHSGSFLENVLHT
ncbi:uncharacterized protein LOC122244805 [Penaeus japonicus]|uniref:uncharacterized protein LOC122244805 n=1 Tax=Penaeus japonicus TaxID=27405 RepID=UPI001C71515B|nr:uncharacterized protein LOC122244805 [Penaeus japonicus]